jgi:hypothetical protein
MGYHNLEKANNTKPNILKEIQSASLEIIQLDFSDLYHVQFNEYSKTSQ